MKKALSFILILTIIALCGCVEIEKPTVAEINGEAISIDEYKVFLYTMQIPVEKQYSEEDWETQKDGKTTYDATIDFNYTTGVKTNLTQRYMTSIPVTVTVK